MDAEHMMTDATPEKAGIALVRPATAEDETAILELLDEDPPAPSQAAGDSIEDLLRFQECYLAEGDDGGFWVAELDGTLIGTVGVRVTDPHSAEIRRLRVRAPFRRRGIGARLLQQAVDHCQERGLLKISLDVLVDRKPAIELFEKKGFRLNRERAIDDRILLDFYIDLYREHTG